MQQVIITYVLFELAVKEDAPSDETASSSFVPSYLKHPSLPSYYFKNEMPPERTQTQTVTAPPNITSMNLFSLV